MRLNKGAFQNCSGLTSVTIGNGVTSIGNRAFEYCRGLTSVTIPDSVTSISSNAFNGCDNIIRKSKGICYVDKWIVGVVNKSLSTAEIENTTRGIAGRAFEDCGGLTSVTIPDTVTSIGNYAFSGCTGLTSVIIGKGVTSIEEWAFNDCSGLKTVFYKETAEQWERILIVSSNFRLTGATRYYYSETEPSLNAYGTAYNGNYWHYDSDGKTPLIWKKETIG